MATIVTRAGKGSPLTHVEVDANFTNLNTDKAELASPAFTGQASFADGSAAAPSIAHTGDLNAGLFFPAADTVAITTSGAEAMRIDASGNLGLGVTPSAWGGTAKALEFSGGSLVGFGTGSQEYWYNAFYNGTNTVYKFSSTGAMQYKQTGTGHSWFTAPSGTAGDAITFTQAMTLNASGNLGIGTSSPSTILHLSSVNPVYVTMIDQGNGAGRIGQNGTALTFGVDGVNGATERMRIDSSGNVGIGTTTPINNGGYGGLSLNGTTGSIFSLMANGTETGRLGSVSGETFLQSMGSGVVKFTRGAGGTESMRIDASGNVGIGTTTPASKLDVNGIVRDAAGDVRDLVNSDKTAAYVPAATDNGKLINITTGGITINASVFTAGQNVTIYNNSASSQTITQGTSVTMYLAGSATTGNRTLAQRGIATILCVASNTFVCSGAGVT